MTTLSVRHLPDDPEPLLTVDGEPVDPDAMVAIRAGDIAGLAYAGIKSVIVDARRLVPARRRTVERDAAGRIMAIVDDAPCPACFPTVVDTDGAPLG